MTDESSAVPDEEVVEDAIDTTVPQSARVWNYLLGGKDNYAVDRAAGDALLQVFPGMTEIARTARHFLARTVRYLVTEAGIRQFLDVGTGLPVQDNTHEVAQRLAPDARIVYVDNDPLVLVHARALLTSTPEGATDYVEADVHDPERILREAAKTLDLNKPVALMLMGILGLVQDYDEARSIVRRLMDGLPSGSYLAHYDSTNTDPAYVEAEKIYKQNSEAVPYNLRSPEQIAGFYEGLELVEPGIVSCTRWRPDPSPFGEPPEVANYGGVGRKP